MKVSVRLGKHEESKFDVDDPNFSRTIFKGNHFEVVLSDCCVGEVKQCLGAAKALPTPPTLKGIPKNNIFAIFFENI